MAGTFGEAGVTFGQPGGTFGSAIVVPPPEWVSFEGSAVLSLLGVEGGRSGVHAMFEGRARLAPGVVEGG